MGTQLRHDAAKGVRVLLAGIGLSVLSGALLAIGVAEPGPGTLPLLLVGGVGLLFFGGASAVLAWRLVRRSPLVTVVPEGLVLPGAGLLRWHEIERIWVQAPAGQRMLGITPVDLDAYLDRLSPVSRALARLNVATGFAPIAIAESALPISLDELVDSISRRLPRTPGMRASDGRSQNA